MTLNRITWMAAVLSTAAVTGLVGCNKGSESGMGGARVSVQALSIADVATVTVVVQGGSMPTPLTVPLVRSGSQFSAVVSSLPVGTNYAFTASAKAADGVTVLYQGGVTNQTVVKDQTANIVINMNQVAPAVGITNEAPVIDTFTASALTVPTGAVVTLASSAHDPDLGDTAGMAWAWAVTCGTLGTPVNTVGNDTTRGTSTVVFTAPATDADCQVNLTVKDARLPLYLQTKASTVIHVGAGNATGNAKISAIPNTCPVISDLRASALPLQVGVASTLTVTATDADGDAISYLWSSPDCTGAFSATTAASTTFTLTTLPTNGNCTFLVDVKDGTFPSGQAKCVVPNHLSVPATQAGYSPTSAPVFGYDYQSKDSISGGDVVKLEIVAPSTGCSVPVVVTWNPALPALSPLDPPFTNGVTYTAPAGAENGAVVTVTVTSTCPSTGLSTPHPFTLVPANSFCALLADNVDCTASAQNQNHCVLSAKCVAHACVPQTQVTCSPSTDQCKDNTCAPATGVCGLVNKTPGTLCNDNLSCTTGDACNAGLCAGTAITCSPSTDQCKVNACTEPTGTCSLANKPNNTVCNDANGCTGASVGNGTATPDDYCQVGVCVPGPAVVCSGANQCTASGDHAYTCGPPQCDVFTYAKMLVPPLAGLGISPAATPWITGSLYTPFDFGSGTVSSSGSADMYLVKLNPATGLATSTFTFGDMGLKDQVGSGLAVASLGNVGAIGTFAGEIDFTANNSDGSGASGNIGVAGLDLLANASTIPFYGVFDGSGTPDAFGMITPIKVHMVDVGVGALLSIASNPTQNAIAVCGKTSKLVPTWNVSGATKGVLTAAGGGGNTAFGGGNSDLVVFKIDAVTGNVIWGKQFGGAGDQVCESVAIDNSGNVIIAGNYSGTLFSLPAVADVSGNTALLFMAKLNAADGTLASAQSYGGTGISHGYALTVDATGNVILAGAIASSVNFGLGAVTYTGLNDAFVVKFSSALAPVWNKTDGDAGYDQSVKTVAVDSVGNVTIAGSFKGTLPLFGLADSSNAALDAFMVQLSANGTVLQCSKAYGDGPGAQAISMVAVSRAATGALLDKVFVGGSFTSQIQLSSTLLDTGSASTARSFYGRATE